MTELDLDIHEDILLRVQVKDLIRCKSVCKSWNSLILSPRFVKSHLDHIRHTNEIGDTRIVLSNGASSMCNDCFYSNKGEHRLVGSSNGLVCISRDTGFFRSSNGCISRDTGFLVVNPSTRELRKLPQSDYEHYVVVSGFGYDSSIDDFKVVIGYRYLPNDDLMFEVLELKTNIWRTLYDFRDEKVLELLSNFDFVGDGILCNGAIHWPLYSNGSNMQLTEIVSFDLSREVFKEISLPKLDGQWNLGTMKDRLCVFGFPNINIEENYEEIEIWVMRNDNVQVPWERKLLPPGYDANKITMDYIPHKNFLSGLVHIWLLEEGSGAPVLVRSIDHPHSEHHEHIRLSTYSECNYNYDEHVFVRSLVSPHGNGNCNEGRVKRKRQNVVSPDGDGRSVKSRKESPMSHSSDGGRSKSKSQINVSSDSDGDERRVERKRRERERESLAYHTSNRRRAKSKRKSLVSSDSDDNRRRVGRKRGERESLAFHSSDGVRAKRKRQRHVSSDYDGDGRVERKRRERESLAFYSSEGVRAERKRQRHVSSDSDGDGRRVERKRRERESLVFHSSDGERAKSKRQSHVSSDSDDDERRVERRRRRERERSQSKREMPKAMRGDTREKGRE